MHRIPGDRFLRREIDPAKIRERREELGLSLFDLFMKIYEEKGVKIQPQTISNWERGVNYPTTKRLDLLAEGLEVPVSYFDKSTYPVGE